MKLAPLFAVVLAACSFEHGEAPIVGDAEVVADSPPGCVSFSSQLDTCAMDAPTTDAVITGMATYNTDTGTLVIGANTIMPTHTTVQGKAGPFDALFFRDVRVMANAKLRVTGSLPVAIIAYGTVTLEQSTLIDVSDGGAGARATCTNAAIPGRPDTGGAGGGGGGGFGGAGGTGGTGNSDGTAIPGGTGGEAVAKPMGPLGGCPGADGGKGDDPGGTGGKGGGAIYIAAQTKIELGTGAGINAGGGGGGGGHKSGISDGDAGGGGGGSGGMILFESPIVRSMGVLAANGGGGGEASGNGSSGDNGDAGKLATTAAPGGSGGSSSGTDGGAGGAKGSPDGAPVTDTQAGGGGGGGGGVGFVVVDAADQTLATTSP